MKVSQYFWLLVSLLYICVCVHTRVYTHLYKEIHAKMLCRYFFLAHLLNEQI